MTGFMARLGYAQNASNEAQSTNLKLQSQQLANAMNQLAMKKQQLDSQAANLAGNYAASADPSQGQSPGGSGSPPVNVPMPGAMPMAPQGGAAPSPQQGGGGPMIPPVNGSQLQPPGGQGAPQGGPQGSAPPPPSPAQMAPPAAQPQMQQQPPWWRTAALAMKKDNPDASGEQIMAALEKLSPQMSQQTKQDFENFKLHIEQQQKEAQLSERERNDTMRAQIGQQNADSNASRASSYDKSINDRNQRALDNIKIKLDAAKAKNTNASNDPAYRALETQYKQVSQDIRSAQTLGSQATPDQLLQLQQRLNDLTAKMDGYSAGRTSTPAQDSAAPGVSGSPAPEAAPQTATGPNGEKLMLQGGQWVPVKGP